MSDTATTAETPAQPILSVTKGNPTDEELAALLLVVAAASAQADKDAGEQRGIWASRARNLGVSSLASRRRSSWGWRAAR